MNTRLHRFFFHNHLDAGSCSGSSVSPEGLLCLVRVCQGSPTQRIQLWWKVVLTHFFQEEGESFDIFEQSMLLWKWSCLFQSHVFYFILQAGDASVGWALGYMLSLSNLLPSEKVRTWKALAPGIWESLTVLFVLLSVTVLVFIALRAREWKKRGLGDRAL